MKINFLIAIFAAIFVQTEDGHPAEEVAEAERAFARISRETNTANAFVRYLAKDAILFREGEPVDGLSEWQSRTPDSTLLDWWPIVADISQSGDLGYTTGPYQYFNQRTDSQPVDNGYYSTIWKKQNGEWKVKVDLGVRLESIRQLPVNLTFVSVSKPGAPLNVAIRDADMQLNKTLNSKGVSFDAKSLAKAFRLHRAIIGPSINSTTRVEQAEAGKKFRFEFVDGEVASTHDFAYSYGKAVRTEADGDHKLNYLRVWRVEAGVWKIVLDVVTEG